MTNEKIENVWKLLNDFRMRHFFTNPIAEVKIEEFDNLMDEIKEQLNSQ